MRYLPFLFLVACNPGEPEVLMHDGACYGIVHEDGSRDIVYRECDDNTEDGKCIFCDDGECRVIDDTIVTHDSPEACFLGDEFLDRGIDPAEIRKQLIGR